MILYIDNIRGFQDQFIELNDVNFLVGENSTGKTTVLSLLELFSDERFLFSNFRNNKSINLGVFNEIISQNSKNKSFTIGIIANEEKDIFRTPFDAISLEFSNQGIEKIRYIKGKTFITFFNVSSGKLSYNISKKNGNDAIDIEELKELIALNNTDSNKFGIIIIPIERHSIPSQLSSITTSPIIFFLRAYELFLFDIFKNQDIDDFDEFEKSFWPSNYDFFPFNDIKGVEAIRAKPQPFYTSNSEEERIPNILKDIYTNIKKGYNDKIINQLEGFGKSSGLYDKIIIKKEPDKSYFEIQFNLHGKTLGITNVGYGISQVLPIITDIVYNPENTIYLIQQPEVHLHPKAQAFLGQFFFDQAFEDNKKFIIETHSDFIIDRFRLMVRKSKKKDVHKRVNILFFETTEEGNKVTKIELDKNGDYPDDQPDKFRDFFFKEQLNLLGFGEE